MSAATQNPCTDPTDRAHAPDEHAPKSAKIGRPVKRRRVNQGGSVTKLPSGKYRVRYFGDDGARRSRTHATKREANDFLATTRADLLRGNWQAPEAGAVALGEYAARWLSSRHDLRPSTRRLYADLIGRWITTPLTLNPSPGMGGRRIPVHLGARHLRNINLGDVREWHAAILQTVAATTAERTTARTAKRAASAANVRAWARTVGLTVSDAGRLPEAVTVAHKAAGSPLAVQGTPEPPAVPVGTTQARQAYSLLREIMGAAVAEGHVSVNPCQVARAGTPRAAKRSVCPTPEEVARLAGAMPDRLAAAVILGAYSGLRGGELFALARRHINLDVGTVTVERTVIEVRGEPIQFGPPKTDASRRTVHLGPELTQVVRAHLRAHVARAGESLLFPTSKGGILPRSRRTELLARARRTIDLPTGITWHSLRHTGATLYARAGAGLADLQARLGHSTVAAAMTYQHASASRDKELAALLDQHLNSPTPATPAHAAATVTPIQRTA